MKLKIFCTILFLFDSYKNVCALNILGVFPYQGKSHFNIFKHYSEELVRRGHNVTVISPFRRKVPMKNYHDISLDETWKKKFEYFMPIEEPSYKTKLQTITYVLKLGLDNCKTLLADEKVHSLLKNEVKFDVVVVEQFNTDCPLVLAHKLGAPVVAISTTAIMPHLFNRFGVPQNPSCTSFILLEGGTRPTLIQRIERTVSTLFAPLVHFISTKLNERVVAQYFDDIPPLNELARRNIKILLLYQNFILSGTNVLPANVIEVGGLHVTTPKPLSGDLRKFVEESKHGVIYISFGTNLNTGTMSKEKLKNILDALSSLPQRVVWKWDEETIPIENENYYFAKWLPQNDLLAHPNVHAFFCHCGNLGITEAMHHGVPVLGMPFFGDQTGNCAAVEESGLGVQIQMSELTKETILDKLKIILNPEFRNNVKLLSKAWHDRPIPPMDTAIAWTEFVAKYPNITYRPRSADVPFYQYLCLDVLAIFVLITFSSLYLMKCAFYICFSKTKVKDSIRKKSKKE